MEGSDGRVETLCAGMKIENNNAGTSANICLKYDFIILLSSKCKNKTKNSYFCILCYFMNINVKQIDNTMKKIFLFFAAAVMTAGVMSAQDINQAIENVNNGQMEFEMGNKEAALTCFQTALTIAEGLGEDGAEITATCKTTIPTIMNSIAKDFIKDGDYDNAVEQLKKTIETADLYGATKVSEDAKSLIPLVYISKGNGFLNVKNMVEAAAAYQLAIDADPANGTAYLRLGQALYAQKKVAEAEAAYIKAAENGEAEDANKQLAKIYASKAKAANKGKKYQEAYDFAVKSIELNATSAGYESAGDAAKGLKKNAEALENYEKAIDGVNPKALNQLRFKIATTAQEMGNKEKAIEYFSMITDDSDFGEFAKYQIAELSK